MKHYSILSILAGLCLLTHTPTSLAQKTGETDVPRTISYQGMLTSTDGAPLADGQQRVTVTLYADPAGTIPVWQETQNTTITDGIFNLYLGSTQPLPSSAELNRPLWVGTALNGELEMRPLTPLSASPYALNLPDRAVTTGKLADGAVTAEKVEMDYVKGFRVNGQEISVKGAILDIRGSDDIALRYDEATGSLQIGQASNRTHDPEKGGASVLATNNDVWTMRGNGRSLAGGFPLIAPAAGDYIGTNNAVTFELRTNNQTAMRYQPNAANTPNIVGGHSSNSITTASIGSTIAGGGNTGISNAIANDADYAVISGGAENTVSADYGTIGGGADNTITSAGSYSAIPGGAHLQAQSFAQSAVGFWNFVNGSIAANPTVTATDTYNVPLFTVGNGTSTYRHNAFEVSYNGHSTVYDINGTGTVRPVRRGSTYTDNVIYAWANANPTIAPGDVGIQCDFGVYTATYLAPGKYKIEMNLRSPLGAPVHLLCGGSVVATLNTLGDQAACASINTSHIAYDPLTQRNFFFVLISEQSFNPATQMLECNQVDLPFTFHVTGRPDTNTN